MGKEKQKSFSAEIKVSMNGIRRNLSLDIQNLRDIVKNFLDGEFYERQELVDAMNVVICHSNSLNCIYLDDNPDFKDMGDIEVELLGDYHE
jgi:hypothetical protein